MCLLQLYHLRTPTIYAVVPSTGKREYYFAVDCMALIQIIKICLCVTVNKIVIQQLRECEHYVFENIKEMIFFRYNDGTVDVFRRNTYILKYLQKN